MIITEEYPLLKSTSDGNQVALPSRTDLTAAARFLDFFEVLNHRDSMPRVDVNPLQWTMIDEWACAEQAVGPETNQREALEPMRSVSLKALGDVAQATGQFDHALSQHAEWWGLTRAIKDTRAQGLALDAIGRELMDEGRAPEAKKFFARSLIVWCDIADQHGEAVVLRRRTRALVMAKNFQKAVWSFQQSLIIFLRLSQLCGEAMVLLLADLLLASANPAKANVRFSESIEVGSALDPSGVATLLCLRGSSGRRRHRRGEAEAAYKEALRIVGRQVDDPTQAASLDGLMHGHVDQCRLRDAESEAKRGLVLLRTRRDRLGGIRVRKHRAAVFELQASQNRELRNFQLGLNEKKGLN